MNYILHLSRWCISVGHDELQDASFSPIGFGLESRNQLASGDGVSSRQCVVCGDKLY